MGQLFELFQEIQKQSSTSDVSGTNATEDDTKSPLANENGSKSSLSTDGDRPSAQTDRRATKSETSPSDII